MTKKVTKSQTAYWQYGDENAKKTLVLIHGYRGTHHGLELIAEQLVSRGYFVIVPDIAGFGESGEMEHYHLEDYQVWLKNFFAELDLKKKPDLLGHSFGSIIVASFAKDNADKFGKLILLNPIPAPVSDSKTIADYFGNGYYRLGAHLPKKMAKKWFSSKAVTLIASEFMIKNRTKENRQVINHAHLEHFSDFNSVKSLTESYQASSINSVKEFASSITSQTLMIVGDLDDIAPYKKQLELKKLFKNVTFKKITGVGHLTHYETPERVGEIVDEFIQQKN